MLKLISMKTIGTTAVSLALLAGTLVTPAFAKGTTGYIKPTEVSNRSTESRLNLMKQIFDVTHGHRFNLAQMDLLKSRGGGGHFDLLFFDQELNKTVTDGTSAN